MRTRKPRCSQLFAAICLVAFLPCLKVAGQDISVAQRAQRTAELKVMKRVKPLVESWLSAAAESQEAIQELLDDPEHRVNADFIAAKIAKLRGEPTTAIEILDRVVKCGTDEGTPGFSNVPAWVTAALWRGAIARHHGDFRVAQDSYNRLLGPKLAGKQIAPTVRALSNLYLAEIDLAMEKDPKDIIRRLDVVRKAPAPAGENVPIHAEWATYLKACLKDGPTVAQKTLAGSHEKLEISLGISMTHLHVSGLTYPLDYSHGAKGSYRWSLELVAQNRVSRMDRSMAWFCLGYEAQRKKRPDIAAKYYRQLFLSDAFLAPDGGIALVMLLDKQGKAEEANALVAALLKRFPKYKDQVEEVRRKR